MGETTVTPLAIPRPYHNFKTSTLNASLKTRFKRFHSFAP